MLHQLCGHCGNLDDPVTAENGLMVSYNTANNVQREVHLHHQCASEWSERFDVSLRNGAVAVSKNNVTKRNVRILIADDFPTILELVKSILNAHPGFEVVGEARDGDHAIALAEALKPDVIVLNVTMPRMSGFEAARRIRSRFADCAIVILPPTRMSSLLRKLERLERRATSRSRMLTNNSVCAIESTVKGEEFFVVE